MEKELTLKDMINNHVNKKMEEHKKEKEENEVCVEPFAYTDEEGNVLDYKELRNIMEESVLELDDEFDDEFEINEEDIVYDEVNEVKEIADKIEPISDLILEVNEGERMLIDKVNCNIKDIPLLNTYLITNLDIIIVQFMLTDAMEELNDAEVSLLVKMEEKYALCTMKIGELDNLGLIRVHNMFDELEMNNVEFRGVTSKMHAEELEELFKDYEFETDKNLLN